MSLSAAVLKPNRVPPAVSNYLYFPNPSNYEVVTSGKYLASANPTNFSASSTSALPNSARLTGRMCYYGDGKIILGGSYFLLKSEDNGVTFSDVPAFNALVKVFQFGRYSNGYHWIIAFSDTNTLYKTVDFVTFTAVTLPTADVPLSLATVGEKIVVSCRGGVFISQNGGASWTHLALRASGTFTAFSSNYVVSNGSCFIVGNEDEQFFRSVDGVTWSLITASPNIYTQGAAPFGAYGNGMWIISGWGYFYLTSTDNGLTWTNRPTPLNKFSNNCIFRSLDYRNGYFLAASTNTDVYTSTDGITWVLESLTNKFNPFAGHPGAVIGYSSNQNMI